jgi:hypothetical protein
MTHQPIYTITKGSGLGTLHETILKCFSMQDCKLVKVPIPVRARLIVEQCPKTHEEIGDMACVPYESVAGSLMYVMVWTQPDIANIVGVLSRYMSTPIKENYTIVKRVFMYFYGTKYYTICYQGKPRGDNEVYVHGFIDAN